MGVIGLTSRNAIGDIEGAGSTFSSWDKCMQKDYCKWPAIVGIVIGSLIILSILFCLFRCLCCGLECCCGCFSCFNHCCPSPRRNKRSRYAEGPSSYAPNSYHGYQPAPSMPPAYNGPQTATFETGKKVHEDALPAMPSWDHAATKKVENADSDDVEMDHMNNQSRTHLGSAALAGGAAGAGAGALAGQRNRHSGGNPASPSPYGNTSPTHAYGGNYGRNYGGNNGQQRLGQSQGQGYGQGYDYSRPSPTANNSYGSQQTSTYGAGQHQTAQASAYGGPTAHTRPLGGFRNPASSDQFKEEAIAPTPNQYNTGHSTYSGSTRYEPSTHYGQESGVTHASSPTSPRDSQPPSILQAGRKPIAGSWRDI